MKATSKKETSTHPYRTKIFYVDGIEKPFSVRSIQHSIAVGKLQPDTEVTDIDGGVYRAEHIADFRAPQWNMSREHDPLIQGTPPPKYEVDIDFSDLEIPDTEMPDTKTTRKTMSSRKVNNASEGTMLGRSARTGNFSVGCVVPPGQPLASHSPERVAKAVELAVRRSADPDFESDDFVGGISPDDIDNVILSILQKRDPSAVARDAALDRTVSEIQEAVLHEVFGTPDNQTDKPAGNQKGNQTGNQTGNQRTPMTSMSVFDFPSRDIPQLNVGDIDKFGEVLAQREQQIIGTPNYGDVFNGGSAFSDILNRSSQ